MSDSFHFDLTGVPLEKCMEIAFAGSPSRKAVGWTEEDMECGVPHLRLYWSDTSIAIGRFPAPLDAEAVVAVVKDWLTGAAYGPEPDTDGHCKKGWRVCSPGYQPWQSFVVIEPVWLVYGK
jgi:hypothetical protein